MPAQMTMRLRMCILIMFDPRRGVFGQSWVSRMSRKRKPGRVLIQIGGADRPIRILLVRQAGLSQPRRTKPESDLSHTAVEACYLPKSSAGLSGEGAASVIVTSLLRRAELACSLLLLLVLRLLDSSSRGLQIHLQLMRPIRRHSSAVHFASRSSLRQPGLYRGRDAVESKCRGSRIHIVVVRTHPSHGWTTRQVSEPPSQGPDIKLDGVKEDPGLAGPKVSEPAPCMVLC
ncbi:hypothetical protein LX36DRAFT_79876 [Colletotrichum falcatum]|nr:hypothetical protein LX36DRAFT_79876 [Colletotrichum falcatum]